MVNAIVMSIVPLAFLAASDESSSPMFLMRRFGSLPLQPHIIGYHDIRHGAYALSPQKSSEMDGTALIIRLFLTLAIVAAAYGVSAASAQGTDSGDIAALLSRASAGDASAQYALGQRYASGTGVARNLEEAYFWLVVAADAGITAAEEQRNTIGTTLRASQFVRVQRRISEWRGAGAQPAPGGAEPRATRPARTGTGIVVADGRILTSNHGIAGCNSLTLQGAASGYGRVTAQDGGLDLALLSVEGTTVATARFRSGNDIALGTEVVVFGYPLQGLLAYGANVTTGIVSGLAGPQNDNRIVQHTAPVQPGNSGAPLLDRSGAVIGVVISKINALKVANIIGDIPQNINFAVRGDPTRSFLRSHGIGVQNARGGTNSIAAIAAAASRFTVLIECWQ